MKKGIRLNGTFTPQELADVISENIAQYFVRKTDEPATSPKVVKEFLKSQLQHKESEAFSVIFLDNRHYVIDYEELFNGTIDGASVYPREVVKRALYHNCAAVILAHNHPSGIAEPSHADKAITMRLKDALSLVDVRVLDHIIVGEDMQSMADMGLI